MAQLVVAAHVNSVFISKYGSRGRLNKPVHTFNHPGSIPRRKSKASTYSNIYTEKALNGFV